MRKGTTFLFVLLSKSLQWDLLQHQASFFSSWGGLTMPFQGLPGPSIFRGLTSGSTAGYPNLFLQFSIPKLSSFSQHLLF